MNLKSKFVNIVVLLSLIAIWLLTPLPAHAAKSFIFHPTYSPDGSKLAFLSDRDGDWKLYVTNANGTNTRVVMDLVRQVSSFAWLDNTSLIASDGGDEFAALYKVSLVGNKVEGPSQLTPGYSPNVASDGTVVYTVNQSGRPYIATMKVVDGAARYVHVIATGSFPVFSPDGNYIAYMDHMDFADGESSYLKVMKSNGTDQKWIAPGNSFPAWSPDGERIAFVEVDNHLTSRLYVINLTMDDPKPFRMDKGEDEYTSAPVWSPDGNWLLFFQYDSAMDLSGDIYKQGIGDPFPRRITTYAGVDHSAIWTPDGTHIVFSSDREEPATLFIMDTAGENVKTFLKK